MAEQLPQHLFTVPDSAPAQFVPGPGPEGTAIVVDEPKAKKTRGKKAPAGTGIAAAEISPELAADLERKRQFYAETLKEIQDAPVQTPEQAQQLIDVGAQCKREKEVITEQKESITKPLNAALTAARRLFDPPIKFLESCEAAIKSKIIATREEQNRVQAAALQVVQQGNGRADQHTLALATGQALIPVPEGAYEVEDWHAEIVDATQLPAAYWIPNMEMLTDLAKRQKGQIQVPGVRFFVSKRLAIRTNG